MGNQNRPPIHTTVLGVGAVGMHAVQAATRYGNVNLWKTLAERGTPGVQVTAVDYDLAKREEVMHDILARTDLLVDATQRHDPSEAVISNEWVGWLPQHAVIVRITVSVFFATGNSFQL